MGKLIEQLQALNSKERFFLIGQILGNPTFTPSVAFREQLSTVLQLQIPEAVFSAMDYHLDWLYASLQITAGNDPMTVFSNFVLASSHLPQKLIVSQWPPWMGPAGKLAWIKLGVPEGLKSVLRCNAAGKADRQGKYWTVISR